MFRKTLAYIKELSRTVYQESEAHQRNCDMEFHNTSQLIWHTSNTLYRMVFPFSKRMSNCVKAVAISVSETSQKELWYDIS